MTNHILIIDDDETVRIDIAQSLRDEGYKVSAAGTGQEGLSILAKGGVDLVLLDLNLPDGDGLTIEQQVRAEFSIPIMIVTARTGQDDRLMALSLGATGYLIKPVDKKEVLLRVRNLLDLSGNGGEAAPSPRRMNVSGIKDALSHQVSDFLEHSRTGDAAASATKRRRYGMLFGVLAAIAVGAGAFRYFGAVPELPRAPEEAQPAPAPAPSAAPVDPAIEKPQAGEPAEGAPVKKAAVAPVDTSGGEPTKPLADVTGYGWALKSKCDPIPHVEWWKNKTHESIAAYVYRKHEGDWKLYINSWFRRLLRLQEIHGKGSAAVTSTGVRLKGKTLADYIKKMRTRLSVTRCLAREAKEFSSEK